MVSHHDRTIGRREALVRAGRLGVAAVALGGTQMLGPAWASAAPSRSAISGVSLPPYPFFANLAASATPAPQLLDALAREYGKTTITPRMDQFLFGWAPARLFERTLAPSGPNVALDEAIWIMHLAGYFGGIWLRLKFRDFGNPRFGSPPTSSSFDALAARLDAATAAATGSDEAALAHAEASLRGAAQVALTDSYGYNIGYLDQILTGSAPTGVTVPTDVVTFTDDVLLDAQFPDAKLKYLQRWTNMAKPAPTGPRSGITAVIEGAGGADDLRSIQASAAARGRSTWQLPFLSITDWDQPSYDSLVETSIVFILTTQITSLAALAAAGRQQADWARQASAAGGVLAPYGGSYGVGLFDNSFDGLTVEAAIPSFT